MLTSVHGEWNIMEDDFSEKEIFIQNGHFGLYLYQAEESYHVFLIDSGDGGENNSIFSYPIGSELHLTYNEGFAINGHMVNLTSSGIVIPPPLLQHFLAPSTINRDAFQVCYDFSTERLSLKIVLGVLALVVVASHGTKISNTVKTLGEDLLQSKIARWFPRAGSPVAGSQTSYSTVKKDASAWFSESPETLYKTSTISRSEEVSESVC